MKRFAALLSDIKDAREWEAGLMREKAVKALMTAQAVLESADCLEGAAAMAEEVADIIGRIENADRVVYADEAQAELDANVEEYGL